MVEQPADKDALQPARIELARWLRSRKAELLEAFFVHVRTEAPDAITDDDAQLKGGLRDMIAACIDCGLESFEQGESWSGAIPSAVTAQARRAACSGVSLTTALRRCVAAHTLAWSVVLHEMTYRDLPDQQRFGLLLEASISLGSLLESVQTEIADAHSSEIRRRARSLEQRRTEIAHKLLGGESPDAGERTELDYDLDGWHLAVIATGVDADRAVRSLQAGLGCELLMIARGGQTAAACLGAQRRITFEDIERVFSMQAEQAEASLAVGESAKGLDGLRVTHREAEGAVLVARYEPRRITRYADVEPEAAVVQDEALADSLIERYLSPLDAMRIGGQKARATLRALFGAEHQVSSAANKLKLNRSTLHRRREDIQQRLGCQLQTHQSNIERAMRIEEWRKRCGDDGAGFGHRPTSYAP
jgi:hypothetical protein